MHFVCSPASIRQIQTSGAERSLPAELGLEEGAFAVIEVAADDPDAAYATLAQKLRTISHGSPGTRIVADYTGGTKSMSVALFLASLAVPGIETRLMAGRRSNLDRTESGTERPIALALDRIVAEREIDLLGAQWASFGYAAAATGFIELKTRYRGRAGFPEDLLRKIERARRASEGFAAWDRFDYGQALHCLRPIVPDMAERAGRLAQRGTMEPLVLWDLWRNAERRAARGQYDDAVSRLYRMIEWSAQWLLRRNCAIAETARVPAVRLPEGFFRPPVASEVKLGLVDAWRLYRALAPGGPALDLFGRWVASADGSPDWRRLTDLIGQRNQSFLAHGSVPIAGEKWQKFAAFMRERFLPMLVAESRLAAIELESAQLPTSLPA